MLVVAVSFHQVFEGMGLGALLAVLPSDNPRKKFIMALLYPLVTPVGMAVGIGIHASFNANDPSTIIVQGAFGSLSAGILFYNVYTELFNAEITQSAAFRKLSVAHQRASFAAMYVGAAAMAIVGIWA